MDKLQYEIKESVIYVSKETLQELMYKDFLDETHIGINLIKFILENDDVFEYTVGLFSGVYKNFSLVVRDENPLYRATSNISKMRLYNGLFEAQEKGMIILDDNVLNKLDILSSYMTFDYYKEQNMNQVYKIYIEGESYEVKCSDMFEFISLKPWDFSEVITKNDELYGMKKEYFLYALNHYFVKNYIKNRYTFNKYQEVNYGAIMHSSYVDIQAINRLLDTTDNIYKDVVISEDLRDYVTKGISSDFSLLEKIIYIYIKLCRALTYDAEFYAGRQKGKVAEKHKDIMHIKDITLENNNVVCYEFNAIFSKFLHEYGINYSCSHVSNKGEYGQGHINVEFRIGKFLLLADALTSVFTGDLFQAKINYPIKGFICMNINSDTMREFNASLDKVIKYIQEEELDYDDMSLKELVDEYKSSTDNIKEIPFKEKLEIAFEKVNNNHFAPMDKYSYIMTLGKILFTLDEQANNIRFEVIKNNGVEGYEAMPLGVLSVNEEGFSRDIGATKYYLYDLDRGIVATTIEEIETKFDEGIYEYINPNNDVKIPGLKEEEKGLK